MAVTNEDILAWMRESLRDLDGVETAIAQLDEAEARELAYKALTFLTGLAHSQTAHLRLLDEGLGQAASQEERYALIWQALAEDLYLGVRGLKRLMREVEEQEHPEPPTS